MAAVIAPYPRSTPVHRPGSAPSCPPLRVIPGGRQAARAYARQARPVHPVRLVHPAVYRRRRLGVALGLVSAFFVAYLALMGLGVVFGDGAAHADARPSTGAAASATAGVPAPSTTYVVQPGDTLWTIARHLHPSGDIRALVDTLSTRAGSGPLQSGQRLSLDGLVD